MDSPNTKPLSVAPQVLGIQNLRQGYSKTEVFE
jgi:hypothetical protein